jgi:hypothetical protein
MKSGEVKNIAHNLAEINGYLNPLYYVFLSKKRIVNLLTGKINPPDKDSFYDFYIKKIKWFKERVKKLKGELKDFQKAEIIALGIKEKVNITYRGKEFSHERKYGLDENKDEKLKEFLKEMRKQRRKDAGLI